MDKSALVGYTRKGSVLVILMALLSAMFAIQAVADAPDPTLPFSASVVVDPVSGNSTLTLSGAWAWTTHERDCNEDRFGVGWAVDWNDPGQAGNNLNNTGVFVGSAAAGLNPADNSVHYYDDLPRCGVYNGTYNTGQWGPMTHVYSPNQTSFSVCVVTYDLHFDGNDSDDVKPNDLIAAAIAPAKYNKDNSVEKNGQTPLGNGCFELSVPTLSTTATGSVNLGQPIQDVATLSGATTEPRATGDITFNLYGPDNATCSGAPIFTTSKSVDGNGAYTSNPFTPTVVGTYRWVASYSGDYNAESHKGNAATSGSCNDPGESSVVNAVVIEDPVIDVTKVADDAVVDAGSDIGFTMEVSNAGPGIARDVTLSDPLPGGDGISWSIVSGDDSCEVTGGLGSQVLACGPKDLSAEASFSVRVVSGTQSSGAVCSPATLDNTAVADAINADEVEASASVSVQCPGISITKVADAAVVDAGSDIGFTMVVTNDGPGLARGVTLNDPLPNGVEWRIESSTLVDPEGAGCLITELNVLSCGPVDLAADASLTVHIVAGTSGIPEVCGRYDNEATVSLSNGPGDSADASTEVLCPLDITLEKDGPALAHRGDEITYDFAVTNSGAAELVTVDLSDPNCDESTLVQVSDGDGDSVLAPGETWRYECTRVITETDPNPLPNTATVVGTDERERSTEDTATHEVDLINPVIDIDKSVDDLRPFVGQTVTFTYVVTNTGDTTLYGIDVVDDVLGPVGTIDELGAGESAEFTLTELVAAATPAVNRGTAEGEDILGKSVTASDDAVITIVLDVVIVPVPDSPDLPRTGAELARLVEAALLLLLGGAILMRVVRGRRELTAQDD